MDSCLSPGHLREAKRKQPRPEFELGLSIPFLMEITVTLGKLTKQYTIPVLINKYDFAKRITLSFEVEIIIPYRLFNILLYFMPKVVLFLNE